MKRYTGFLFIAFMSLAPVLQAQNAINSGAKSHFSGSTLPLRNLSIEVRQVSTSDASSTSVSAQGAVQLRSGASSMQGEIQSSARQSSQSANSQQQVLVLNGRAASIALRNSVPLRLVQTVVHNGVMIIVPGVVMLEAGTGFSALPRWDGQGPVELAISALQGQGRYQAQNAGTATLVMVSLGEWVTVAQSDQQSISTAGSWSGSVDDRQATGTLVQVRVTAP